jgi:hypothetical protein
MARLVPSTRPRQRGPSTATRSGSRRSSSTSTELVAVEAAAWNRPRTGEPDIGRRRPHRRLRRGSPNDGARGRGGGKSSSSCTGRSGSWTCSTLTATASSSPGPWTVAVGIVLRRAHPGRALPARHAPPRLLLARTGPGSLVSRYVRGWGTRRHSADRARERLSVGAAWYRVFSDDEPGWLRRRGDAGARDRSRALEAGHGIGDELLQELIAKAKAAGYDRLSLSVGPATRPASFTSVTASPSSTGAEAWTWSPR